MLKDEMEVLESLIREYSLREVIEMCAHISKARADEYVDRGMTETAKRWTVCSVLLDEVSPQLSDVWVINNKDKS